VKHVPPSRANVMVPWSCLVNRQATWRPKDSVLWKSTLSGKPIPVSWMVTVSCPAGMARIVIVTSPDCWPGKACFKQLEMSS
jgi:hypothetical protein